MLKTDNNDESTEYATRLNSQNKYMYLKKIV